MNGCRHRDDLPRELERQGGRSEAYPVGSMFEAEALRVSPEMVEALILVVGRVRRSDSLLKVFARRSAPGDLWAPLRRWHLRDRPPTKSRRQTMCLNCGCGEPETRHQETDITADDVRQASAGKPIEQTVQNMRAGLDKMGQTQGSETGGSMSQPSSGGQSPS